MNDRETIESLNYLFTGSRGHGSTEAIVRGLAMLDQSRPGVRSLVFAWGGATRDLKGRLKEANLNAQVVPIDGVTSEHVRGFRGPVAFDFSAVMHLTSRLGTLQRENEYLRSKLMHAEARADENHRAYNVAREQILAYRMAMRQFRMWLLKGKKVRNLRGKLLAMFDKLQAMRMPQTGSMQAERDAEQAVRQFRHSLPWVQGDWAIATEDER
jgi:hypothetical protein